MKTEPLFRRCTNIKRISLFIRSIIQNMREKFTAFMSAVGAFNVFVNKIRRRKTFWVASTKSTLRLTALMKWCHITWHEIFIRMSLIPPWKVKLKLRPRTHLLDIFFFLKTYQTVSRLWRTLSRKHFSMFFIEIVHQTKLEWIIKKRKLISMNSKSSWTSFNFIQDGFNFNSVPLGISRCLNVSSAFCFCFSSFALRGKNINIYGAYFSLSCFVFQRFLLSSKRNGKPLKRSNNIESHKEKAIKNLLCDFFFIYIFAQEVKNWCSLRKQLLIENIPWHQRKIWDLDKKTWQKSISTWKLKGFKSEQQLFPNISNFNPENSLNFPKNFHRSES